MPANFVLLERTELNASAASVTFANIPQTGYTDLKVVMSIRGDAAQILLKIQPNGNTTGLSRRSLYTDNGTAAFSASASDAFGGFINSSAYTANTFASLEAYFPNYTSSTAKSYSVDVTGENNATTTIMGMVAGLDTTTSPITSLLFAPNSGNFVANSTFSLYGLAALGTTPVIAPKATGGNRIDNDGTYWYHTFTSSGTFTPATGLSADVLVIAGGAGGGGFSKGGGGGAGGVCYQASRSLTTSSIAITVGAGGSGGGNATKGNSGSNSVFDTITALGGGGGGVEGDVNGVNGGSGGAGTRTGTYGTATQGNSGGATGYGNRGAAGAEGIGSPLTYGGGGGGGSGAVGNAVTQGTGGVGGAGLNTWSSWASATSTGVSGYYAGGGGGGIYVVGVNGSGGAGGSGGGGQGSGWNNGSSIYTASYSATANTGSGGGGGSAGPSYTVDAGAGGSGIVIIRYAI